MFWDREVLPHFELRDDLDYPAAEWLPLTSLGSKKPILTRSVSQLWTGSDPFLQGVKLKV